MCATCGDFFTIKKKNKGKVRQFFECFFMIITNVKVTKVSWNAELLLYKVNEFPFS